MKLTRNGPQIIEHVTHHNMVTDIVRIFSAVESAEHPTSHGTTIISFNKWWDRHRCRSRFRMLGNTFVRRATLFFFLVLQQIESISELLKTDQLIRKFYLLIGELLVIGGLAELSQFSV